MFLQNILQQRLQSLNDEEAYLQTSGMTGAQDSVSILNQGPLPQQNYLKAQTKVGSVHNRQLNYGKDQTCFNRWEEDNDPNHQKTKMTVQQVKQEIDRDFLGTKRPAWNTTVGTTGHPPVESTSKELFEIKKGLRDERVQKTTESRVYAGTDTRDAYHTGWNTSTELVHPRDSNRFLQATREPMLVKTQQTNAKMLMNKTKMQGVGYTAPEQLSKNIQKAVRTQKDIDSDLRARLQAETRNEFPGGTEEAINAIVTRKIYELEQAKNVPDDPELTLKPNMKKTIRHETVIQRHHNGKYEVDRFSDKGKKAWSCCMNKREESEGCVIVKQDKQRWNVEGF